MSALAVLAGVFALHVAPLVSPGPTFLVVSRVAARSRAEAMAVVLGVTAAEAFWAGLAALGLGVLLERAAWLAGALKVGGGLYLVYLGLRAWLSSGKASPGVGPPVRGGVLLGFLTGLTNPKAIVFLGSILVAGLPAGVSPGLRAAAVALITLDAFLWFALVALVLSQPAAQAMYLRFRRAVDKVSGAVMVVLGARLALER